MNLKQIEDRLRDNGLLNKMCVNKEALSDLIMICLEEWSKPHRYYHNLSHLSYFLEELKTSSFQEKYDKIDIEKAEILAFWHDVIYNPKSSTNEEDSIDFIKKHNSFLNTKVYRPVIEEIFEGIRYTKYSKEMDFQSLKYNSFIRMVCGLDVTYLHSGMSDFVKRELLLLKEFQFVDFKSYREKRLDFINNFDYYSSNDKCMIRDFLSTYRPKIGVYAGSFNPFHIGHMNVLEQAENIFDKVIIAVGRNPLKNNTMLIDVKSILPYHEVIHYDTLLPDFLKTLDYADITIVRGLRNGYDLQYEMNQLRFMEDYGCKLPVAYFMCGKDFAHISSSDIRGLGSFQNSYWKKYIPKKYKSLY